MKPFSQKNLEKISDGSSPGNSLTPSLDSGTPHPSFWSERVFEFLDLNLQSRSTADDDLLFVRFKLQRVESDNFGNNQNPIRQPLLLSLKAEKKEVALLTGLLGRQVKIEESLRPSFRAKEEMEREIQRLRDVVDDLAEENTVLKRSLMELQRPRRVS